jgi:hypothetical protein
VCCHITRFQLWIVHDSVWRNIGVKRPHIMSGIITATNMCVNIYDAMLYKYRLDIWWLFQNVLSYTFSYEKHYSFEVFKTDVTRTSSSFQNYVQKLKYKQNIVAQIAKLKILVNPYITGSKETVRNGDSKSWREIFKIIINMYITFRHSLV